MKEKNDVNNLWKLRQPVDYLKDINTGEEKKDQDIEKDKSSIYEGSVETTIKDSSYEHLIDKGGFMPWDIEYNSTINHVDAESELVKQKSLEQLQEELGVARKILGNRINSGSITTMEYIRENRDHNDMQNKLDSLLAERDGIEKPKKASSTKPTARKSTGFDSLSKSTYNSLGINTQRKGTIPNERQSSGGFSIGSNDKSPILIVRNPNNEAEMLRIEPNGDIYVKGNLAQCDAQVVDALRQFLRAHKFHP